MLEDALMPHTISCACSHFPHTPRIAVLTHQSDTCQYACAKSLQAQSSLSLTLIPTVKIALGFQTHNNPDLEICIRYTRARFMRTEIALLKVSAMGNRTVIVSVVG